MIVEERTEQSVLQKWRKLLKTCHDLDLDWTMRSVIVGLFSYSTVNQTSIIKKLSYSFQIMFSSDDYKYPETTIMLKI